MMQPSQTPIHMMPAPNPQQISLQPEYLKQAREQQRAMQMRREQQRAMQLQLEQKGSQMPRSESWPQMKKHSHSMMQPSQPEITVIDDSYNEDDIPPPPPIQTISQHQPQLFDTEPISAAPYQPVPSSLPAVQSAELTSAKDVGSTFLEGLELDMSELPPPEELETQPAPPALLEITSAVPSMEGSQGVNNDGETLTTGLDEKELTSVSHELEAPKDIDIEEFIVELFGARLAQYTDSIPIEIPIEIPSTGTVMSVTLDDDDLEIMDTETMLALFDEELGHES
jgi:hypothetical protein